MRKNDYLLLAFLIALTSLVYFFHNSTANTHDKILIIQHDQNILQKIQLQKIQTPKEITIPTEHGIVIVQIDHNGAYVANSPCRDKLCMHQGKITQTGQSIVCMPEKVLITLTATEKEGALDAIIR